MSRIAILKNLVCSCCVLYPVDFPHRVGTHAYPRKGPATAGFRTHNMAGPSNMTTSALGFMSSGFSGVSSRLRTMSDLVPNVSIPLADSDDGHG